MTAVTTEWKQPSHPLPAPSEHVQRAGGQTCGCIREGEKSHHAWCGATAVSSNVSVLFRTATLSYFVVFLPLYGSSVEALFPRKLNAALSRLLYSRHYFHSLSSHTNTISVSLLSYYAWFASNQLPISNFLKYTQLNPDTDWWCDRRHSVDYGILSCLKHTWTYLFDTVLYRCNVIIMLLWSWRNYIDKADGFLQSKAQGEITLFLKLVYWNNLSAASYQVFIFTFSRLCNELMNNRR